MLINIFEFLYKFAIAIIFLFNIRRGTSSRFVPPVMNREEYGVTSKRR